MDFPLVKTKVEGVTDVFDIDTPSGRHEYFQAKAAKEIEALKTYLDNGESFVSFWLAKKGAGKGTYSKMLAELLGEDRIAHISLGDVVRHVHQSLEDPSEKKELESFLEEHYRGILPIDDAIEALINRDVQTLLPTEFMLALVKREVIALEGKAIMMDGFPRGLDQVSYSLYFREIMNIRYAHDFFVLVDVPDDVLSQRIQNRVVCPVCHLSRNTKFLLTADIRYESSDDSFALYCDNPACSGAHKEKMVTKESDELGLEGIRDRLEADQGLIDHTLKLQGVDRILLRNTIPTDQEDIVDAYEISKEKVFSWNGESVEVATKPWLVKENDGSDAYSLMSAPVVLSLIKQMYALLIDTHE